MSCFFVPTPPSLHVGDRLVETRQGAGAKRKRRSFRLRVLSGAPNGNEAGRRTNAFCEFLVAAECTSGVNAFGKRKFGDG